MRHCNILLTLVTSLLYAVAPALASAATVASGGAASAAQAPPATAPAGHIAVLLPIKSRSLGAAAMAVRDGVQAAAGSVGNEVGKNLLPIVIYPTGDKEAEVLAGFDTAVANQARIVIGPLGRSPAQALARSGAVTLPTIALSAIDPGLIPNDQWYTLTLSVELEARQAAQLAWRNGGRIATTIQTDPTFGQRIQASFADEWQKLGGEIRSALVLKPTTAELKELKNSMGASEPGHIVFLAVDAKAAKQIRPWLGTGIAAYATSQAFDGQPTQPANMDLIRMRFVDAPWLVQADYFAALGYLRPTRPMRADLARLYALGIDAWRVAQWLAQGALTPGFELDGVTGQLKLGAAGTFQRTPLAVEIGEEAAVVLPP